MLIKRQWRSSAGKITASLAESPVCNCQFRTCGLTAKRPGSAPSATVTNHLTFLYVWHSEGAVRRLLLIELWQRRSCTSYSYTQQRCWLAVAMTLCCDTHVILLRTSWIFVCAICIVPGFIGSDLHNCCNLLSAVIHNSIPATITVTTIASSTWVACGRSRMLDPLQAPP